MDGNHPKYMLVGGAGGFVALLVVGVPLSSALLFAVVLACLLMVFTDQSIDGSRDHRHHP